MALSKSGPHQAIPKDAVILSEDDALKYQWKVITNWDRLGDVWSLRYTPGIISALAAATGIYVNNHYRNKLRLGPHGRMSTYLPIVVIPAMFTMLSHKFFIQRPIILNPLAECPVCVQLRAAAFQTGLGVVYPTMLAPLAAFMFATRNYTYRLPSIISEPKEVFNLWRKFTRPIMPVLSLIVLAQSFIVMYLTGQQEQQNFNLIMKLREIESKVDEEQLHDKFKQ